VQARIANTWRQFSEGVAALALGLMFAAFVLQIFSRYILNMPVAWTLEVCAIAYVWVTFWTAGVVLGERQQIVFDVIYSRIPPASRRWLAIANTTMLGLVFLIALPGVADYIAFLARRSSMLLKIRMDLVYSCFLIFMVAVVAGSALRVWRLAGPRWRQHL
jgi:TRAP-type C4-dicarboxylate transport system permease small subunit